MNKKPWLNKEILALGFTSFFSDIGSEMVTALLPSLVLMFGPSAAIALGVIEGIADFSVVFTKIISGWLSDFVGKRKIFAVIGYFVAAIGVFLFSLAASAKTIFVGRLMTRLGKGTRDPARDALLVDLSQARDYGKVFGFHRAMDTLGSIVGPIIAYLLLPVMSFSNLFIIAGTSVFISFLIVLFFVREPTIVKTKQIGLSIAAASLPVNFFKFLFAVGIFRLGYCSVAFLILRVNELFVSPTFGVALYGIHSAVHATLSYPAGHIGDVRGKKLFLIFGYVIAAIVFGGFAFMDGHKLLALALFALFGVATAFIDALERGHVADLLPQESRGLGYGTYATVLAIGNLVSNLVVGALWGIGANVSFMYCVSLMLVGIMILTFWRE